jgi:hypothetical protein
MTTNYLRDYGTMLIERGYNIIPIRRGCKAPLGVPGWQNIRANLNKLGQWIAQEYEGVGVLCGNNPAVDIDVLDENVSAQMVDWVSTEYPGGLIRVGRAPKTLLAYRTDSPFRKVRSATYESPDGNNHAVEILSDGQQYVAFAEHPDTLQPYVWNGQSIVDVESDDLPAIDADDALAIVREFERVADAIPEWTKIREGTGSTSTRVGSAESGEAMLEGERATNFATLRPPLDITTQQIRRDLASIQSRADNYDSWLQVGMALWHQFDGDEEGLELWDAWSASSDAYDGADALRSRWSGLRPDPSRRPTTFATVRRWANQERMDDDPEMEFLHRYVYVADGDFVHDLAGSPHDKPFEMKEFRNFTSNIRTTIEVPAPIVANEDRTVEKVVPVHSQWMVSTERKSANAFTYVPGASRTLRSADGRHYINRFHTPIFPDPCAGDSQCEEDLLGPFFRHIEFIVPVEVEREWFISWMSYNLQYPGKRCKVTPLLIATDHGTGRGWIVALMNLLLGSWNCSKTKMSTLNGDSSAGQYQDFMNETLLCAVEEVKDADKPYGVLDSIRSYLTEDSLEINLKYGAKETKRVYTNFLWNSNHSDALVLKAEDRRINVFKTEDGPKGADYYERLYNWLEPSGGESDNLLYGGQAGGAMSDARGSVPSMGGDQTDQELDEDFYDRNGLNVGPGVACLWHYLMRRDLSGFRDNRPIDNKSRRDLIESCQTDVESLFLEMVKSPPAPLMTMSEIHQYLESEKENFTTSGNDNLSMFGGLSDSEKRQIKKLCGHHLGRQEQVKISYKIVKNVGLDGVMCETREAREKPWKVRSWSFRKNWKYSVEDIREIYERK